MKFGLPTMIECKDIDECVMLAKSFGIDFVEINMSFPQYNYNNLSSEHLKELKEKYGVFFTIHADEMLSPFDFNTDVSECYFEVMRRTIRFALLLDMPIINLHLQKGVYATLPDRVVFLNDEYREEYIRRVRDFILMCEEEIGNNRLKIAIENVDTNPFTPSQIDALGLFMQSSVFALTLDVGHLACLMEKDFHIFKKYPEKLKHMHLHDSDGKHAHLPLGTAGVDIGAMLSLLPAEATCLVEVKNVAGLEESVKYLISKGYMRSKR